MSEMASPKGGRISELGASPLQGSELANQPAAGCM